MNPEPGREPESFLWVDRGQIRYPEIPDNAMPEGLVTAVDECTGERERALLTEGMWADPVPVPCINCGGPLVRVERRDRARNGAPIICVTYEEAYYRLGAAFGADVYYKVHDPDQCLRERLRQDYQRRAEQ